MLFCLDLKYYLQYLNLKLKNLKLTVKRKEKGI